MTESSRESIRLAMERMARMPHREAISGLPEFYEAQVVNSFSETGKHPFKALVFNMECGTRLDKILPFLQYHRDLAGADIILANELDWGMARSGNLNTSEEIARHLEMNYAFATEFITVSAWENGNREGRHGNAIFSRFPLKNVSILRLPILYDWFYRKNDSRLGTRVALLAEIEISGSRVGLMCLHLENRATPEARKTQLCYALKGAEKAFDGIPVLIGGDMNTNTVDGDAPDGMDIFYGDIPEQARRMADIPAYEPLMPCAQKWGYSYEDCNIMDKPTRRKHAPGYPDILLNLDWFFQRGLACWEPKRVETVFSMSALTRKEEQFASFEGQELSDHDAVAVTCALKPDEVISLNRKDGKT